MDRICVVGASGFLGKFICNSLKTEYALYEFNSKTCNVKSTESVDKCIKDACPYGLVYCSGIKTEGDSLADEDVLKELLDVNLFGAVRCMQTAMKYGVRKIVTIGSADATFGNYKKTMYAVSKAALHEYTKCFAAQVKSLGIDVFCLVPGTISTELEAMAIADFVKAFMNGTIRNINSQLIRIDGGHHTFPL